MGNQQSSSQRNVEPGVFSNELAPLKQVVNNIIDEKDLFKNKDYNFLSQDVCKQHYVLLQQELNQHLKVDLEALGTSLYIIPKNDDEKLTKLNLSKAEICQKISNHYIKILYIICLIKYVFNLEHNGDMSIAGIVFRNFKILDDIMEIDFCAVPHKDYSKEGDGIYKIDLSNLEGMSFFTSYFLTPSESRTFLSLMKLVLAKKNKSVVRSRICAMIKNNQLSPDLLGQIETLYQSRFGSKLVCTPADKDEKDDKENPVSEGGRSQKKTSLSVFIEKENPIFSSKLCMSSNQIIVKTNTAEGKKILGMYKDMHAKYSQSLTEIMSILDKLVSKDSNGEYVLKDITKEDLEKIIQETKTKVKIFYMQSIMDYQAILEFAKTIPNISLLSSK